MLALLPLLSLGCAGSGDAPADSGDPVDTADSGDSADTGEADLELRFRYVVLADPHVSAPGGDAQARLDRAVAWVNANAEELDLRLVLIVGDIAWGDGVAAARQSLDALAVTWVPISGDNEIAAGSEQAFHEGFADHWDALATTLDGWEMPPAEVWNPEWSQTSWFHNLTFTYEGVRFIGLDWASRDPNDILGEMGELHDFEGGTWPFFEAHMTAAAGNGESVVLFSHIPMHFSPGGFDTYEMERVAALTSPRGEHVWADLAGHYHITADEVVPDAGYHLYVTDATWDDAVDVRLVEVWGNDRRFAPLTEVIQVK